MDGKVVWVDGDPQTLPAGLLGAVARHVSTDQKRTGISNVRVSKSPRGMRLESTDGKTLVRVDVEDYEPAEAGDDYHLPYSVVQTKGGPQIESESATLAFHGSDATLTYEFKEPDAYEPFPNLDQALKPADRYAEVLVDPWLLARIAETITLAAGAKKAGDTTCYLRVPVDAAGGRLEGLKAAAVRFLSYGHYTQKFPIRIDAAMMPMVWQQPKTPDCLDRYGRPEGVSETNEDVKHAFEVAVDGVRVADEFDTFDAANKFADRCCGRLVEVNQISTRVDRTVAWRRVSGESEPASTNAAVLNKGA